MISFFVMHMTTRLIMIRHGESIDNIKKKVQDQSIGSELTEKGIKQAEASAERLKNQKVDAIYSSSTKRTIQTAEIINKYHNLEIIVEKNLIDRNYGILIGTPNNAADMTEEQIEIHKKMKEDEDYKIPNGESFRDVKERVIPIIENIVKKHKDKSVVISSHGNVIRAIVCSLLNIPLKESYKMKSAVNCSYTEIRLNGKPELVSFFCVKHLSDI